MDAVEIATLLELPLPTPEQAAIIEAPMEPTLVVAGAGSGKTETMAARVVYLVANGLVEPDRVLGLTFTRKAAGELAVRLRNRLAQLESRAAGTIPPLHGSPTVATYNAYAGGLVSEHGLRIGVEPGSRLIGEAARWQLVDEVVRGTDADLAALDKTPRHLANQVVSLLGQCAEHLIEPELVVVFCENLIRQIEAMPGEVKGELASALTALKARAALAPLVSEVKARKRQAQVLDFADQVAWAARLAELPEVAALERERFAVVLLDEYQDTSVAQLAMLTGLFGGGGHGVTAVGDPHQSIYAWRGASAGNLESFPTQFRASDGTAARVHPLTVSWRTDEAILAAANEVALPLVAHVRDTSALELPTLRPRPTAGAGLVQVTWTETIAEEIDALAGQLAGRWWADEDAITEGTLTEHRSMAVLCRRRADLPAIEAALIARGVPVRMFGLGGLLDRPEVGDVVATLQVLADPTRGEPLVRLLTGPRWRIGPRDLRTLHAWASEQSTATTGLGADAGLTSVGLVEALDQLPPQGWVSRRGDTFTDAASRRLHRLSRELDRLRRRISAPLPELVLEVERSLGLDVELASWPGSASPGRGQLDAFLDVAAEFASGANRLNTILPAFLAWLDAAAELERGLEAADNEDPPEDEDQLGAVAAQHREVHLMTMHAAKGLEWDVVAIPHLVERVLPHTRAAIGKERDAGWVNDAGLLPYPLRGDRAQLPSWSTSRDSVPELAKTLLEFKTDAGHARIREERRLAYVAFTRPRAELLLSGSWWRDGSTARVPSRFLTELLDAGVVTVDDACAQLLAEGTSHQSNPAADADHAVAWPVDPLGQRRTRAEQAAAAVREQLTAQTLPLRRTRWTEEVDALLAERERAGAAGSQEVELPNHVSASIAVALAKDPAALALSLRRPIPAEPTPGLRLGTAFHAWVERRLRAHALVDLDDLPGASDDPVTPGVELAQLRANFEASPWAQRQVVAVEVNVETVVAGTALRGRVDAVFARDDGGVDIVDWKVGAPPKGEALQDAAIQLAIYRVAWSRLHDLPIEGVHACFFHVTQGITVEPVAGLDEQALVDLLTAVPDQEAKDGQPGRAHVEIEPQAPTPSKSSTTKPPRREPRSRVVNQQDEQLTLFGEG